MKIDNGNEHFFSFSLSFPYLDNLNDYGNEIKCNFNEMKSHL